MLRTLPVILLVLGCAREKAPPAPPPAPAAPAGIAPGGTCERHGANDNCLPVVKWAREASKGSRCVTESPGGTFCTHACEKLDDCDDMKREGFTPTCFGPPQGMCLFDRK